MLPGGVFRITLLTELPVALAYRLKAGPSGGVLCLCICTYVYIIHFLKIFIYIIFIYIFFLFIFMFIFIYIYIDIDPKNEVSHRFNLIIRDFPH